MCLKKHKLYQNKFLSLKMNNFGYKVLFKKSKQFIFKIKLCWSGNELF